MFTVKIRISEGFDHCALCLREATRGILGWKMGSRYQKIAHDSEVDSADDEFLDENESSSPTSRSQLAFEIDDENSNNDDSFDHPSPSSRRPQSSDSFYQRLKRSLKVIVWWVAVGLQIYLLLYIITPQTNQSRSQEFSPIPSPAPSQITAKPSTKAPSPPPYNAHPKWRV